jgi:hypothetical protein
MGCCNNPNYQSRAARESINRSAYEACQCATQACECKDVAVQAQISAQASAESASSDAYQSEAIWNDFQTRYMGAYATDPVTTSVGALYFNTSSNLMFVWNGTSWDQTIAGAAFLASSQTFTGNNVFSVNSSFAAVRITQTGTGEAFVVEDSTNPDSTPFTITNSGNVQIGTNSSSNSLNTILEISSTSKGFLPPRMSTTFRNLILTPPAGLIIYNTSTNKLNIYNGTTWEQVTSS